MKSVTLCSQMDLEDELKKQELSCDVHKMKVPARTMLLNMKEEQIGYAYLRQKDKQLFIEMEICIDHAPFDRAPHEIKLNIIFIQETHKRAGVKAIQLVKFF